MRWTAMAIGALVALMTAASVASATAMPAAKPRIVAAWSAVGADRTARVVVRGRDRDDVVRGVEIAWGDGLPEQGISSCEARDARRRGRVERFELSFAYPAAGAYTVTVRVLSGGCGKRPQQRSAPEKLTVHVG